LFGDLLESRIHARLHGPLPQNLGAESVNGSDGRFFQRFESLLQALSLDRVRRGRTRLVQFLPQPDLQLTCRLMREGDGDNAIHRSQALGQHLHNARHQLGSLTGACRCFHDEALCERLADGPPGGGVG